MGLYNVHPISYPIKTYQDQSNAIKIIVNQFEKMLG